MTALLNVDSTNPEPGLPRDPPLEVVDRKPEYQMADGLPLMLWDCVYHESDVRWQSDNEATEITHVHERSKSGAGDELYHQLHSIHARGLIHTAMESHFLSAVERYHTPCPPVFPLATDGLAKLSAHGVLRVPLGGGTFRRTSKYTPLLLRKRLDNVELVNERYRLGKGERKNGKQKMGTVDEDGDE
jgi:tRNA pseudouridine38/39 synthase